MEAVNEKKIFFPLNGLRVCVDQLDTYDISGRVYSKMAGELIFSSFSEFLLKTDRLMDEKKFPQSFQQKRSFEENTSVPVVSTGNGMSDEEILEQKGTKFTFDLVIQSRKRTTWQGFLRTDSGKAARSFESVLEMTEKFFAMIHEMDLSEN